MNTEKRKNLETLASYLEKFEPNGITLDMAHFSEQSSTWNQGEKETNCGSLVCAIGFGPYAGITKNTSETWLQYSRRVFWDDDDVATWEWMFGGSWEEFDNTPDGAVARIRYVLANNGAPEDFEGEDDIDEGTLTYEDYTDIIRPYHPKQA